MKSFTSALVRLCLFASLVCAASGAGGYYGGYGPNVGGFVNANETSLTPANVNVASFGKWFTVPMDGQVYAEPLLVPGLSITAGAFTTPASIGIHDTVIVATEHDTVYALDSLTGVQLWKRSFLNAADPYSALPGATSVTTVPAADTGTTDISVEIGITSTPVIDPVNQILYLVAKTVETVGGVKHYVQRLHALNLSNGTEYATPYLIGDTRGTSTYVNVTQIYVYGSGVDSTDRVTDPYNGTGKTVVQFNALRQHQRLALSLVNNQIYVGWASHADNGPYHGWIACWDVSALSTTGFQLKGVLNSCPNAGQGAGFWQGASRLAFEPDGSAFYAATGNAFLNALTTYNASGFPALGNYSEALLKITADPTTTPANQNINGWGLKVADYFQPYNVVALDNVDADLGSGGPTVLPDSAGIAGHPRLLTMVGKGGTIYVVDRDNLGKYNAVNDNVVNSVPNGSGNNTPTNHVVNGVFGNPPWYNARLYVNAGYGGPAKTFAMAPSGRLSAISQTTLTTTGQLCGSPFVSASGATNGIVWILDRNTNDLRAYDAATLATELWNTSKKPGSVDKPGAVVKFSVATVANGAVYLGTSSTLVAYGLIPPPSSLPLAPSLTASALSGTSVGLNWLDSSVAPNTASGYKVEISADGVTFAPLTTAPGGAVSLSVGGLAVSTSYWFRVRGYNGNGDGPYSNAYMVTTSADASGAPAAPTGLGATPTTATSITLTWTNNATNQTGFLLDRANDAGFTTALLTQSLPDAPSTFVDTAVGLAPSGTYFYRIRSNNTSGASANSNTAQVTIPVAPPRATNTTIVDVIPGEVDLTWIDHAGTTADGYRVLRAQANGTFSLYADLPAPEAVAPSSYIWSDLNLTPGTFYEYHIVAYNTSGNNDFDGANFTALTDPPSNLLAVGSGLNRLNTLTWTAPFGAVSYRVYRGTSSGAETLLAANVGTAFYQDTTVVPDQTYFYKVSAVNANASHVPVLPSESGLSNESSAAVTGTARVWTNLDVGAPALAGGTTFNPAASSFTVKGGGSDIWFANDQFQYNETTVSGDSAIVARLTSLNLVQGSALNVWAKAGIMFRDTTSAGAMFVDVLGTAASGVSMQWRNATSGQAAAKSIPGVPAPSAANPLWLRLVKSGTTYTGYYATGAATPAAWTLINSTTVTFNSANFLGGLAVTSHDVAGTVNTTFDNLSITSDVLSTALPAGWTAADVGAPGQAGGSTYNSANGTYTVNGGGSDIWFANDQFQYASQTTSGDQTLIARVTGLSLNKGAALNVWAKSGIMFRDTTGAGSMFVDVLATAASGVSMQWRSATAGQAGAKSVAGVAMPTAAAPVWLKLVKSGTTFTGYYATGTALPSAWTLISTTSASFASANYLSGLAVTSHDNAGLVSSTFDNVSLANTSLALPSGWSNADIGAPALAGASSYGSGTGAFTVTGGGSDIWFSNDQFQYAFKTAAGDQTVVARVTGLNLASGAALNVWAKAGIMFRDTTSQSSMFVDLLVTQASGISMQWRSATSGLAAAKSVAGIPAPTPANPIWLKLVRTGTTYTAYYALGAATPATWILINSTPVSFASASPLVGFSVTSHDVAGTASGVFDNVVVGP